MIKYSNAEGFTKSKGIGFIDSRDRNVVLPKVAIGVFSRRLFHDIVQKFNGSRVNKMC